MTEQIVRVDSNGTVHFIWDDELGPALRDCGTTQVRRASHVEPTPDARFEADLSPVNGPLLGPFETRQEALDAEVAWLKEHLLGA